MRRFLSFERHHQRLAPFRVFAGRLIRNGLVAALMVGVSLAFGIAGYRGFEGMGWIDAFANAAMILSGMGPLSPLTTDAGKLFAGLYAIYSGVVLVFSTTLLLAPVLHRLLHHFHIADEGEAMER